MRERRELSERALNIIPELRDDVEVTKDEEGNAHLKIPRPRTRWVRFLSFIFRLPDHKILVLDDTGTEVLDLIDGRRTFRELSTLLGEKHALQEDAARASLGAFVRRLAEERAIRFLEGPRGGAALEGEGV